MQHPTNARIAFISIPLLILIGCGPSQPTAEQQQQLQAGYTSYDARDYDQAMAQADRYLSKRPTGKGTAEALY